MKEICIYNENKILEIVAQWSESKMQTTMKYYRRLLFWVTTNNPVEYMGNYYTTDTVLDNFLEECAGSTYSATRLAKTTLNSLFRELNIDYEFKAKASKHFERDVNYYSLSDIQFITSQLANAQDKFIIYALFEGIRGVHFSDLTGIKVTDVDFEYHIIHLPNRDVKMNEEFEEITKKTIFQEVYYKWGNLERTSVGYELNMKNEYVLKPKPYSKNNQGIGKFTESGLKTRINKINEEIQDIKYCPITSEKLVRSGILITMKRIEDETGIVWNQYNLRDYKKENHLKFDVYELLNIYRQIYNK